MPGCATIGLQPTTEWRSVMGDRHEVLLPNGLVAPMLTPFEFDRSVSHERYVAHAHRLLGDGCAGLAPFGTTGEALSVSVKERTMALEALVDGGIDPGVLVVGTGLPDLPSTVHLVGHAVDLGCRACMVLPPFYFKGPSDEGLFRYFASLIDQVGDDRLRIVLYHIPQVAGVGIPVDLAVRLRFEFPEVVVAVKDSSGDWAGTEAFFGVDGLTVYPGAELPLLDALDLGGPGCITATANVNAAPIAEVIRLHGEDNRSAAADAMERVVRYRLALQEHATVPAQKRLLALRRDDPVWATVRPPFVEMDETAGQALGEILAAI